MDQFNSAKISAERGVGATFVAIVTIQVWAQALSAALAAAGVGTDPNASVTMTLLGSAALAASAFSWARSSFYRWVAIAGLAAAVTLLMLFPSAVAGSLALGLGIPVTSWFGRRLSAWLPTRFDGAFRRRRGWAAAWGLLALISILQMGRLSSYMGNPEVDWFLTTKNPFWATHECLPAYFQAAGLAADGESNVYHAAHYPALTRDAEPQPELEGMIVEDPFQYAPQFLLWPYLATQITTNYAALRLGWFALHTSFVLLLALVLARWIGGRAGASTALLSPLVLAAFPALHALQYGQFHLVAIGLALTAMLAFSHKRLYLGGALLAVSVLSKLFPGILLVVLAAQRRFRELASVAVFGTVLTVAALLVFGTAPFSAFFGYHLERLADGSAFAFGDAWPEIADLVVADNQGFFGLVTKLAALGVPGASEASAMLVTRLAAVAIVGLAFWSGYRRSASTDREAHAVSWLGLLGLASMLSTGAFGDYVPATATWLLTLVAYRLVESRRLAWVLIPVWAMQFFLVGTTPIGDWFQSELMMVLSAAAMISMAAVCGWAALGAPLLSAQQRPRRHHGSAAELIPPSAAE